jgi:GNAT superfamily N-acetyltransferase
MNIPFVALKFRRNIEDYGWSVTLRKSLGYLFRALYTHQVYRIYSIDLTKPHVSPGSDGHGLTFRILSGDDDRAIDQIENVHEWLRGGLKESIKCGALCLAALEGDFVAGFNLIGFGEVTMHLVNKRRAFRSGQAWSEQIAVDKAFRQRGLGAQLRYRAFEELRGRGFKRLYGGALTSNIASLKLARKVGFREVVDVHYWRVMGRDSWRYVRVKP